MKTVGFSRKTAARLLLGACLLTLILGGCGAAAGETGETNSLPGITVGCDTYPPFSYMDVDGNLTGIDIDLARAAFARMGYAPTFVIIPWEEKKTLLKNGDIDCVWSSFTMDGREEEYRWAGPYMESHQVVAVNEDSDIYTLADLEGKSIAVQSTTKPEDLLRSHDSRLPQVRKVLSVQKRDLIFLLLSKGYADALAAHDTSVEEFMAETGMRFRILEEPLLTVGLGVAFDREDDRGLDTRLDEVLAEMRRDGTAADIIGKDLSDTERYLGGLHGEE